MKPRFNFSSGEVSIGADPEIFVKAPDGSVISSHRFIDESEVELPDPCGECYSCVDNVECDVIYRTRRSVRPFYTFLKRDGAQVEFDIPHFYCRDAGIPAFGRAIFNAAYLAREQFPRSRLSLDAVGRLSKASLQGAPDDVTEFGCDPDIDAYSLAEKQPNIRKDSPLRYLGGHLHYGTFEASKEDMAKLAIAMDYYLGNTAVALLGDGEWGEQERARRRYYGQAGSFRVQPHGFEYRTLSSRILLLHPAWTSLFAGMGRSITGLIRSSTSGELLEEALDEWADIVPPNHIRSNIDNHNYEGAIDAWRALRPYFDKLPGIYRDDDHNGYENNNSDTNRITHDAIDIMIEGVLDGIQFPDDPLFNWQCNLDHEQVKKYGAVYSVAPIGSSMTGGVCETVFPFRKVLQRRKLFFRDSYGGYNFDNGSPYRNEEPDIHMHHNVVEAGRRKLCQTSS